MTRDEAAAARVSEADAEDIRAALTGDEDAFARLLRRHQPAVFHQMWHFSRDRDTVEDLVQEVFVEVFLCLEKFGGRAPFLHWVTRIAVRVGYRHWRRNAKDRRIRAAVVERLRALPAATDMHTASEAAQYLYELLESLPPKERVVLTLYYFEDCSTKDMAERLGWSHSLVRVRMHRARRRLRDLLIGAGFGGNSRE